MNTRDYITNVLKTESNDFDKIHERLNPIETQRLLHAGMGLVTEAGEFMDMLKKHIFYGKIIDFVNLKEELGDLLWYIGIAAQELGEESFERIMETNIGKLKARYGDKFGETQAENRDLVKEREVLENTNTLEDRAVVMQNEWFTEVPQSKIYELMIKFHQSEVQLQIHDEECDLCTCNADFVSIKCLIHGIG